MNTTRLQLMKERIIELQEDILKLSLYEQSELEEFCDELLLKK